MSMTIKPTKTDFKKNFSVSIYASDSKHDLGKEFAFSQTLSCLYSLA